MAIKLTNNRQENLKWISDRPIAHRGLHDIENGIYENTLSAAKAAVSKGYNIELDIQPSSDMVPMVFHDYKLNRLTNERGDTRQVDAQTLAGITIKDTNDKIPTLEEFLALIKGEVGFGIELKGKKNQDEGFVKSIADLLASYNGPAAIMSFHHHILLDARNIAPQLPLGLTAQGHNGNYLTHKDIAEECNVDFISYELAELDCQFVHEFKETGRPAISWTVRSKEDQAYSDKFVDQVTFEGFTP